MPSTRGSLLTPSLRGRLRASLPPALAEKPARLSAVSPEPRCGAGAQVCTLTETGSHPHERSVGLHQALARGPRWPALHFPDPRRPRTHKNQPQAPNAPLPLHSWGPVAWAAARTWAGTEVGGPGPSASFGPQFLWKPQQAGWGGRGGEGGVWPSHATPAGALSPQAFGLLPLATVSREEGRTRHMF